jgi:hypothetical protein
MDSAVAREEPAVRRTEAGVPPQWLDPAAGATAGSSVVAVVAVLIEAG